MNNQKIDMPLISIVVPVYNVEKYLDRCLESIVNQTYNNLEIILVDDESPDTCPQKCEEWAIKDSRIKVVHKKNEGLGMARNTGIDNALGRYICFFDSDDYVALDTVERAYSAINQYDADIVSFGMSIVDTNGQLKRADIPNPEKDYYQGDEIIDYIIPNMLGNDPKTGRNLGFNMSSSGRMYSMDLIRKNNWRYVSEREYISEDFYSLLELYHYVKSEVVIKDSFYYYCYNEQSLTNTFREDRFKKICIWHKAMLELAEKCNYPSSVKERIDSQFLGSVIGAMKNYLSFCHDYKECRRFIFGLVNDEYLCKVFRRINFYDENFFRKIFLRSVVKKRYKAIYIMLKIKNKR